MRPPAGQQAETEADEPAGVAAVGGEVAQLLLGVGPVVPAVALPAFDADLDPDHHDLDAGSGEIAHDGGILEGAAGGGHAVQRLTIDMEHGHPVERQDTGLGKGHGAVSPQAPAAAGTTSRGSRMTSWGSGGSVPAIRCCSRDTIEAPMRTLHLSKVKIGISGSKARSGN